MEDDTARFEFEERLRRREEEDAAILAEIEELNEEARRRFGDGGGNGTKSRAPMEGVDEGLFQGMDPFDSEIINDLMAMHGGVEGGFHTGLFTQAQRSPLHQQGLMAEGDAVTCYGMEGRQRRRQQEEEELAAILEMQELHRRHMERFGGGGSATKGTAAAPMEGVDYWHDMDELDEYVTNALMDDHHFTKLDCWRSGTKSAAPQLDLELRLCSSGVVAAPKLDLELRL